VDQVENAQYLFPMEAFARTDQGSSFPAGGGKEELQSVAP
jgi:hypothetical protein